MLKPLASHYSGFPSFSWLKINFYVICQKFQNMEWNPYAIDQHEIVVHEKMKVHREESVFPAIYPCSQFMGVAGITRDFHTLMTNAGLEHFVDDQPFQYAKLAMSVVQDFNCNLTSSNSMVHYKIYNKSVDLPFAVF